MTRPVLSLVALAVVVTAAPPVRGADEPRPRTVVEQRLSGIDFLPDRDSLDQILSGTGELVTLANTEDVSPGVRIRAFRTLGFFDDAIARAALVDAVTRFRDSSVPNEQLYLIAALEALGELVRPGGLGPIVDAFGHDRRDVRAAAARALGEAGLIEACPALQEQFEDDDEPQVIRAVAVAIDRLNCPL